MMKLKSVASVGTALTLVSVLAIGYANAASDPLITACANKSTGALRSLTKGSCKPTENKVTWNAQGPVGPQGVAGPQGATGPQGVAGAQGVAGLSATTAPTTTTAPPSQHVGDIGPGGGPIFYVDVNNEYPFSYLEVAPSNATNSANNCTIGNLSWSNTNTTSGPLTSDSFGQGRANTLSLLATCVGNGSTASGYDQLLGQINQGWFVPNIAEMKTLLSAEKLGAISMTTPVRYQSACSSSLMTSSIVVGASLTGGVPFWSWGCINQASGISYSTTVISQMSSQIIRLIRAG